MLPIINKTSTITDDRGSPHIISWSDTTEDESCEYLARRVGAEIRETDGWGLNPRISRRDLVLILAYLLLMIGASAAMTYTSMSNAMSQHVMSALWPLVLLGGMLFRNHTHRAMYQRAAIISVEEGACGSCWYKLCDLPSDNEGMLVCPECQAAWRASRMRPGVSEGRSAADPLPKRDSATKEARTLRNFLGWDEPIPLKDDRGRMFSVVRSQDLRWRAKESEGESRKQFSEAAGKLRRAGFFRRFVFLMFVVLVGFLMYSYGSSGTLFSPQSITDWLMLPLAIAVMLFILASVFNRVFRADGASPAEAKEELLACSVCPSCGSSLAEIKEDEAGLAVCDQCSAAWKMPATYDIRSLFRPSKMRR